MAEVRADTPGDTALERVLAEIGRLRLQDNLIELETRGFTTVKGALSDEHIGHARTAIRARAERTLGHPIDLETATAEVVEGMTYLPYLLYDDEVFEAILMAPKPLALITYLLGESCVLSSLGCHFRGPGGAALALHSDNGNGMPAPFSHIAQVANVNYALTPYSREAGALAMVPGSHRYARQPRTEEMRLDGDAANPRAVSMDLEPGDAVVWHGNTWHGSFVRSLPGVRINLAVYFCRQHVQTQEQHKGVVPEEVLARHANDARFKVLLGGKQPYGWRHEGPDYSVMARNPRGWYD